MKSTPLKSAPLKSAPLKPRLIACHHSVCLLPMWVRLWVLGILIPVNAAPFWFLDTSVGQAGAAAALFVVAANASILLVQRGISALMALPHLIVWIPLTGWLAARLLFDATLTGSEAYLAMTLVAVNGISLVFDTIDGVRWLCGQRGVLGRATP